MELAPYLDSLRRDLTAAAAPGGDDVARAAELLGGSLEASARMCLLEALSDAAAEITTRLTDATVEVRLRGRSADLVVTAVDQPAMAEPVAPALSPPVDGGDLTRLTLRMPEALKTHVEQIAAAEGVSVNAWLVRAVTAAISHPPAPPAPPAPPRGRPGKQLKGYFQA